MHVHAINTRKPGEYSQHTRYLLNKFIEFPLYFHLFRFERFAGPFHENICQDRDVTAIHQQTEHLEARDDHSE